MLFHQERHAERKALRKCLHYRKLIRVHRRAYDSGGFRIEVQRIIGKRTGRQISESLKSSIAQTPAGSHRHGNAMLNLVPFSHITQGRSSAVGEKTDCLANPYSQPKNSISGRSCISNASILVGIEESLIWLKTSSELFEVISSRGQLMGQQRGRCQAHVQRFSERAPSFHQESHPARTLIQFGQGIFGQREFEGDDRIAQGYKRSHCRRSQPAPGPGSNLSICRNSNSASQKRNGGASRNRALRLSSGSV